LRRAKRFLDDGALTGHEPERQAHDFQGKQQVGKDDCSIDFEDLSRGDRYLGSEAWLLADFDERMVFANGTIFAHVAAGLSH